MKHSNDEEIEVDANQLADNNGAELNSDDVINHSSDVVSLEDIEDAPEINSVRMKAPQSDLNDEEDLDQQKEEDEDDGVVDYYSRKGVDPIGENAVDEDSTPSVGDAGHPGDDEDTS